MIKKNVPILFHSGSFRKKTALLTIAMTLVLSGIAFANGFSHIDEPDSAYLFSYTAVHERSRGGLRFAWSIDQVHWHAITPDYKFLVSDYGAWGMQKKMHSPFLFRDQDGLWHCVWSLNHRDGAFAHSASKDLIDWRRQSYPVVSQDKNCLQPEVYYDHQHNDYVISWLSEKGNQRAFYYVTTRDFKNYTATRPFSASKRLNISKKIKIGETIQTGLVHKVSWHLIDGILKKAQIAAYQNILSSETTSQDPVRFQSLKPVNASVTVFGNKTKKISDHLIGVFFEDINYAADGGLYAELVQNRGFEYKLSEKKGQDPTWTSLKAWSVNGDGSVAIDTLNPISVQNPHYAKFTVHKVGAGLVNDGFNGIAVKAGALYDFSVFARNPQGRNRKLLIRLVGKTGAICGQTSVEVRSSKWEKLRAVIKANQTIAYTRLEVIPQATGRVDLDMISLFPRDTFKRRKNGMRDDLAKAIAAIHPKFIRFPGGCVAHGDGIKNIYHWENTIGPLKNRTPQRDLWGYHQSKGLGFYEYFQFAEDIGAEPVPVVAAGVPCQNSSTGGAGQQGGIQMCNMGNYVQQVLNLIQWANGDTTTVWGRKRAEEGHPQPFHLKYIGVGNEDLISDVFQKRFTMIYEAIREKYPNITVIGTVGPFYQGTDYEEGWKLATKLGVPMVDEHYYVPPGWFIHNQDFYDKYDRSKSKVYLGEYAAHLPGRPSNVETSLAEALYLTSVERNADVVRMTSYAPLLAKDGNTQWRPDLIYFDNTEVKPTVDYYVQKLFGTNSGNTYISNHIALSNNNDEVKVRVGMSVVRDSKTHDLIIKMVNLLPVAVHAQIKLDDIGAIQRTAKQTILTGAPGDEHARPVSSEITVGNNFQKKLPKYSFTLIRIRSRD